MYVLYMVSTQPHIDGFYNHLELFNDVFVLLLNYSLRGFVTSSMGSLIEPDHQWVIGYAAIAVVGVIYTADFFLMLREVYNKLKGHY